MASRTATKDIITLRGSAAIVAEFFGYAANSILYNRGVYPEESFAKVKKYGLQMLLTQDEGVKTFISNLTAQLSEWLEAGKLQRMVLVIMSKASGEVLERWNFSVETDSEVVEKGISREKSDKEIMREIQAIMRQIISSVTFLPCLEEPCVFDVLAYTDTDVAVPFTWIESDPKLCKSTWSNFIHLTSRSLSCQVRGTCTTAGDVLYLAELLLSNGFGDYNLFKNSCEDFTIY